MKTTNDGSHEPVSPILPASSGLIGENVHFAGMHVTDSSAREPERNSRINGERNSMPPDFGINFGETAPLNYDYESSKTPPPMMTKQNDTPTSSHKKSRSRPSLKRASSFIILFYAVALISAVVHYLLFKLIDGKLADRRDILRQSRLSSISLLLVTIFKASLTASIGTCFAQHLWQILRQEATAIKLIEQLFVLRTNIAALCQPSVIRRAPLLFSMALFIWCLGIAMIYPPGALTVKLEPYSSTSNQNLSVLNPPFPENFNPMMQNESDQYPTFAALYRPDAFYKTIGIGQVPGNVVGYLYNGPLQALYHLAKQAVTVSQIRTLPRSLGENSTYLLDFRAPQWTCESKTYNETKPVFYGYDNAAAIPFYSNGTYAKSGADPDIIATVFIMDYNSSSGALSVTRDSPIEVFTTYPRPDPRKIEQEWTALVSSNVLTCEPQTVRYNVNISYPKGVQQVNHFVNDPLPLEMPYTDPDNVYDHTYELHGDTWPWSANRSDVANYPKELKDWIEDSKTRIQGFDHFALLQALGAAVNYRWMQRSLVHRNDTCGVKDVNGTKISYCPWNPVVEQMKDNEPTVLEGSVFDLSRLNGSKRFEPFNPLLLDITESNLNAVMSEFTLSTLSLGNWWRMVPVNNTEYLNTFQFTHPLNLILPYCISLGIGAIFLIVGIWSMHSNGIPAADGGFLQVMMATRGDTEMEKLVFQGETNNVNDISTELKQLKVRYGELSVGETQEDRVRRLGFGTVEETLSLRRRYKALDHQS